MRIKQKNIKLQNELLTAVKSGNNKMLEQLVESLDESLTVTELLNHQFGESKTTVLHLAAKANHKNVIWTLLLHGADPTVKDKQKKVPFLMAESKDTRNTFRKFMGEQPERYDYKTAQIPAPLSKEDEEEKQKKQAEKKFEKIKAMKNSALAGKEFGNLADMEASAPVTAGQRA